MKYAEYIKQIEIASLWDGKKHIVWHLDPHVNILSGVNGGGKSTILDRMMRGVRSVRGVAEQGITVQTVPEDADYVRFDKISMPEVRSDFDNNLQRLTAQFATHQHDAEALGQLQDIIDELFSATEKTIIRTSDSLALKQWGRELPLQVLSNGEKQMLTILLMVYLEDRLPTVIFMDEPEVSLHIEWQKQLIDIIRRINPNAQIILTTHSPAVIMNGWMDCVTEVDEITI